MRQAQIYFDESGDPFSKEFNDRYFNSQDALEEVKYVFLEGNNLHTCSESKELIVGESGFGSGLNFLSLWSTCRAKISFVSFEAYPLSLEDLKRVHVKFPKLKNLAKKLQDVYTCTNDIFEYDFGDIKLTILFKEALEALEYFPQVDVWFLDGFDPRLNPDMWSEELFLKMAQKSKIGTTLATFTASSNVRRALQSAGFTIFKRAGYGKKRQMITGIYDGLFQRA